VSGAEFPGEIYVCESIQVNTTTTTITTTTLHVTGRGVNYHEARRFGGTFDTMYFVSHRRFGVLFCLDIQVRSER
jgi:hypothetical protein